MHGSESSPSHLIVCAKNGLLFAKIRYANHSCQNEQYRRSSVFKHSIYNFIDWGLGVRTLNWWREPLFHIFVLFIEGVLCSSFFTFAK